MRAPVIPRRRPRGRAAIQVAPIWRERWRFLSEEGSEGASGEPSTPEAGATGPSSEPTAKPQPVRQPRVLVVDDEDSIRLLCHVNLRAAGFETIEAADGEEALAAARAERPDLILLDVMMPRLNGWTVAEELAGSPETEDIPIVFLSARTEVAEQARAYDIGAVAYLRKPFEAATLASVIGDVLERIERGEREQLRREGRRRLGEEGPD
jgi:two-component system, sensor histidine kinase ChiS